MKVTGISGTYKFENEFGQASFKIEENVDGKIRFSGAVTSKKTVHASSVEGIAKKTGTEFEYVSERGEILIFRFYNGILLVFESEDSFLHGMCMPFSNEYVKTD